MAVNTTPRVQPHAQSAVAKTYTHGSNRRTHTRVKDGDVDSKIVFKSVLENPFHVRWPTAALNVQNSILARVVALLQGVAEFNNSRRQMSVKRKRKRAREHRATKFKGTVEASRIGSIREIDAMFAAATSKGKSSAVGEVPSSSERISIVDEQSQDVTIASTIHVEDKDGVEIKAPESLACLTIGINEVTKRLERQCRPASVAISSTSIIKSSTSSAQTSTFVSTLELPRRPIRVVLACRHDVDPPILLEHVPALVASCNSNRRSRWHSSMKNKQPVSGLRMDSDNTEGNEDTETDTISNVNVPVKLVPLPKGSEATLAQAVGLRRATLIALEDPLASDPLLQSLLESIPAITAPWHIGSDYGIVTATSTSPSTPQIRPHPVDKSTKSKLKIKHIPTHVKQLRTTAPRDMRAAKNLRAKKRAEGKLRRKERKDEENGKVKAKSIEDGGDKEAKDVLDARKRLLLLLFG